MKIDNLHIHLAMLCLFQIYLHIFNEFLKSSLINYFYGCI
jgi:hypothetical protein